MQPDACWSIAIATFLGPAAAPVDWPRAVRRICRPLAEAPAARPPSPPYDYGPLLTALGAGRSASELAARMGCRTPAAAMRLCRAAERGIVRRNGDRWHVA